MGDFGSVCRHPPKMTDEIKDVIKKTWILFKTKGEFQVIGLPMFNELFNKAPETKAMFHYDKNNPTRLNNHMNKLFEQIDEAVTYIDNLSVMSLHLMGLGEVHHKLFNVDAKYYSDFGECLIVALKTAIADDNEFGKDEADAWQIFYDWLGGNIVKGINAARIEEESKRK